MKRNRALDFLKFVFAVIIVLLHGQGFADFEEQKFFRGGYIGVEFFFLVSGCMMAMSSEKKVAKSTVGEDTFEFIKHKICGFLPNVYVAWVLAVLVSAISEGTIFNTVKKSIETSLWELCFLTQFGLKGIVYNAVTWYISASLLCMIIIWPIMRRFKDTFFYIIAPLGFCFIMGYLFRNYGMISDEVWNGYVYKGTLRAFAEILGGALCYKFAQYLRTFNFTKTMRIVFSLIEWGLYGGVIFLIYINKANSVLDFVYVAMLMLAIVITVSQVSYDNKVFNDNIYTWLGTYSFSLYLGHYFWIYYLQLRIPKEWGFYLHLAVYFLIALVSGLVIMYTSNGLKRFWKKMKPTIRKIILIE